MSLANDGWGDHDRGERFVREPLLERVDATARGVLARVTGMRYGALAVCTAILLLVVLLVASRLTAAQAGHPAVRSPAGAGQLHREQAQVALLSTELRSSQQKLQAAQQRAAQPPPTTQARATVPARQTAVPGRHGAAPGPHLGVSGRHAGVSERYHLRKRVGVKRHSRRGGK